MGNRLPAKKTGATAVKMIADLPVIEVLFVKIIICILWLPLLSSDS
jgi:hypothetical protein